MTDHQLLIRIEWCLGVITGYMTILVFMFFVLLYFYMSRRDKSYKEYKEGKEDLSLKYSPNCRIDLANGLKHGDKFDCPNCTAPGRLNTNRIRMTSDIWWNKKMGHWGVFRVLFEIREE